MKCYGKAIQMPNLWIRGEDMRRDSIYCSSVNTLVTFLKCIGNGVSSLLLVEEHSPGRLPFHFLDDRRGFAPNHLLQSHI